MLESQWVRKLDEYWGHVLMIPYVGTEFAMNWPDRFVSSLTWCGWIEFKNPKTVLRDAQWVNIRKLQQFGTMACVVRRVSTKKDFRNEKLRVYITDKKQCDAETTADNLLVTLAEMFSTIQDTTHNFVARPGFFEQIKGHN